MKKLFCLFTVLIGLQLTFAQNSTTKIEMTAPNWSLPKGANFERFDNRETLVIKNGKAVVKNQKLSNGTIEVDIYANSKRSFAGIFFRSLNNNMEEVYLRFHKSNQADAVQYTPIFNNESNWQLYREYQTKVSFKNEGWNTLRINVNNRNVEVFVNDEKVMSIDHLRTDNPVGEFGLWALFTNRFSNFRMTKKSPIGDFEKNVGKPIDSSIITEWEITNAKPYEKGKLNPDNFSKEKYSTVITEKSGLLPISKYLKKTSSGNFEENKEDYTIASKTINVGSEQTKIFSFDYSDKIIVYFNGKRVFRGNNSFRTKGVQHMGHMNINTNKLYLPLVKGKNTIHCVVIDKANGWGLMGKLE